MYKWQQIKVLSSKGIRIKRIAKMLKISKNTVKRYLSSIEPPKFKAREYERVLDGYGDKIKEMLRAKYIGTRILAELKEIEPKGTLSIFFRISHAHLPKERSLG